MAKSIAPIPLTASRAEQIFPTLTAAQLQLLVAHGLARSVRAGEVLVELGDKDIPVFVAISGELEVVRPSFTQETLIRIVGPGNFTGESTRFPAVVPSPVFAPAGIQKSFQFRATTFSPWCRRMRS
jgi:hypothetical protein